MHIHTFSGTIIYFYLKIVQLTFDVLHLASNLLTPVLHDIWSLTKAFRSLGETHLSTIRIDFMVLVMSAFNVMAT